MPLSVIGAGQFGRRHREAVRAEPQCELVAVADPAYSGEERFADYREMLDRVKPDGVIIATPNAWFACGADDGALELRRAQRLARAARPAKNRRGCRADPWPRSKRS